jgi:uncharacterized protein YndB with AHSA1/START domain
MKGSKHKPDPKLDLVLERVVDVPSHLVWEAWTEPKYLKQWFCPLPWKTIDCETDLRPGGIFRTIMRGPEGQELHNVGCYLEVIENEKLVFTSALLPGYRPVKEAQTCGGLLFTAIVLLESQGRKTKYTAIAIHGDEASRKTHDEMGFQDGWGKALDQMIAMIHQQNAVQ